MLTSKGKCQNYTKKVDLLKIGKLENSRRKRKKQLNSLQNWAEMLWIFNKSEWSRNSKKSLEEINCLEWSDSSWGEKWKQCVNVSLKKGEISTREFWE